MMQADRSTPDFMERRLSQLVNEATAHHPLRHDGGDGTYDGMEERNFNTRLARLEGGNLILLATSGVVAAVFLGLSAATLYITLDSRSETRDGIAGLAASVNALPQQINSNLLELNRTLASAITAASSSGDKQPTIIFMPAQSPPSGQKPPTDEPELTPLPNN